MKFRRFEQRKVILFLLPCLTVPTVNVIGELMFSDIAVAILAPLYLFNRKMSLEQPYLKKIMLLLGLWLIAAIISDVVNGTSMANAMRGTAAIIFFGLHLFVFFVLIDGQKERYIPAIIGTAFAVLLQWATDSSEFWSESLADTPWKMGGGFAVTILFLVALGKLVKTNRMKGRVLLLLAPIHLYLNARSLFLTTALAGFVSVFQLRVASKKTRIMLTVGVLVSFFVVFPLATSIYGSLNEAGVFGEEARDKYLMQTAGGKVNILIAGRSESILSFNAISDAPFFGHGSWAESRQYYYMYLAHLEAVGKDVNWDVVNAKERFLIPSHSMLFGSWVYHGIVGGIFWLFILYITLKALGLSIGTADTRQLTPLELMVLFALLWDIFFSPFGQARRCIEAVYIAVACIILAESERKKMNKNVTNSYRNKE